MGHTKTAVSLPDDLFDQLQRSADAEGKTRSAVVVEALLRHFDRQSATAISAALKDVYSEPWTEGELREEKALARAHRSAARRISALLRESEDEPWRRPT